MRQIGFIDEERDAARFGDYLLTNGIVSSIEEMQGGAWAVWIEDDDHLDRARAELDQFRANPADPRYDAAGEAQVIRKRAEKAEQRRRQKFVDVRTRWAQPGSLARPVTMVLAVISIIASIVGTKLGFVPDPPPPPTPLANAFSIAPVQVDERYMRWDDLDAITKRGQVWRLVTPIFLHFSILHLIFNMFWLLDLGSMIETRRGSIFLLVMVVVTAAVSNLAEYYVSLSLSGLSFHPNPSFGGMSGVVYALFGYVWMKGKYQPHLGIGVQQQTVTVMLVWLVLCMTGLVGNVANTAHLVGLLGGVAFGYLPYAAKRLTRGR